MENDRRQFLRIRVPGQPVALDEQGKKLGRVEEAGGGGMRIRLEADGKSPAKGSRIKITVVEAGTNHVIHTASVLVRYSEGAALGLEFVAEGPPPGSA
ncbi:MAG TPA: PilZ domain-containing protein [Terriglobales bacterium]|nr:PilZ domain-containing protein [Terriglobales bacterium]